MPEIRKLRIQARRIVRDAVQCLKSKPAEINGIRPRAHYLGTGFQLTPSGKFLLPFERASVAEDCSHCDGTGRRGSAASFETDSRLGERFKLPICPFCAGIGSREIYEDESFVDELESAAEKLGCAVHQESSAPFDFFLVELRS